MKASVKHFILALQFLTRLPTPQIKNFVPDDLAHSAPYFPLVGCVLGVLVAGAAYVGQLVDPWAGAFLGVLFWTALTGALHLDGLGDLADALGASHANPDRFHEVMKDPHMGAFGAISVLLQVMAKLIFLMLLCKTDYIWLLIPLIAAARLGPLVWTACLPVLKSGTPGEIGSGERFSWATSPVPILFWALSLVAFSLWLAPVLLSMVVIIAGWWLYLKIRLGGQTGDCLGAGIEICESAGLASCVMLLPLVSIVGASL
ncbi:MAG: adenosylcobinamide-GDP ribazoletransferase [Parvibaculaceae bacterium]|jgi:adenosylcobinamide-GDP ribazoletransferase